MDEPAFLDITGDVCPMNLVRVRMAMDRLPPGATIRIRMASGEPVGSIPRTLRDEGHELLGVEPIDGSFDVSVRKKT